jgi:HPt (histidine-containing phosphotransfer) domain-containing protein
MAEKKTATKKAKDASNAEQGALITKKLNELVELAKKKKNVLEYKEINEAFRELNLNVKQLEMILEYLPAEKVDVTDADAAGGSLQGASSGYDFHGIRRAGVDTKAGEDNCGGEEEYIEVLRDYASSGLKDVYALREYLDNGDYENFTIRVHSIKSTSRMIGAFDIGNVAERLENAGEERDEEYILDRIPAFLVDLFSLCEAIVKTIGLPEKSAEEIMDENEGKNELPDMSVLDEAFVAIREFADNADQDNVAFVLDTLSDYKLPPDILKSVENIRKFAEDFKWEEVSNELDRIHKDIIV